MVIDPWLRKDPSMAMVGVVEEDVAELLKKMESRILRSPEPKLADLTEVSKPEKVLLAMVMLVFTDTVF